MERTPQRRPALRQGLAAILAFGLGGGISAATVLGQSRPNTIKNEKQSGPPVPGEQTLDVCKNQQAPLKSLTCSRLGKILLSFDQVPIALSESNAESLREQISLGQAAVKQQLNLDKVKPEVPPVSTTTTSTPNVKTVPMSATPNETSTTTTTILVTPQPQTSSNSNNSLQTWLYDLRMCESGDNYQDNTGNGYYGAYQFSYETWNHWDTGYAYANEAPSWVQDATIIKNTNASSGGLATQNPGCYEKEKLSQFPPAA